MYSSIKMLCSVALTGTIAMSLGTTLAPAIAHAQTADPPAGFTPLPGGLPAGTPPIGIPYASERADGKFFVGSIALDGFELEDGQISVTGSVLRVGRSPIPTVFPVEIIEATCGEFTLEIGPPPILGLLDPLLLEQSVEGGSDLRVRDFCAIAAALADGDLEEVVSQLNEEDEIAAGLFGADEIAAGLLGAAAGAATDGEQLPGSCPWQEWVGCSALLVTCGAFCLTPISFAGCLPCIASVIGEAIQPTHICGRCFTP